MDVQILQVIFPIAWCANTAYGSWNPRIPSLNQCAVTALVVQDYLEGKILRTKLTNRSRHFLNRLPDGTVIDFTKDQLLYISAKIINQETIVYSKSQLTRHKSVMRRYDLLSRRVRAILDHLPLPAI